MCELFPVTFHGDTVFCVDFHGEPFTPMRPIVENMGMSWATQSVKLNANKTRWGVLIIKTPSEGGEQQTLCIPVRKLPAFLASINPRKVKPELRPKIELYQNECDDVLWDYWTKGHAERNSAPAIPAKLTPSSPDSRKPLRALVHAWAQISGQPHSALWPQVKAHFQLSRIDDLPEEWISDALAFVQGKIDAHGQQPAIAAASDVPSLPDSDYPAGRKRTMKQLEGIIRDLETLRAGCVFDASPSGYTMGNTRQHERAMLESHLYALVGANLCAAWNALKAGAQVKSWA